MKVEVSEVSSVTRTLTIEVPEEDVRKEFARAYRDLSKRVRVPGFRPGKAPRALLARQYGKSVAEDVVLTLVPEYSRRAVKEAGIHPITVEFPSLDHTSVEIDQAFSFTTTVEIEPKIDLNGTTGISLKKEERSVSPEDEEKALDTLRHRQAELHAVTEDRETIDGDFVSVDIVGFAGGRPVQSVTQNGVLVHIGSKSKYLGTELDPCLVNRRKGEAIDATGTYPKDAKHPELSEQTVALSITIREVKTAVLPELDDAFAADLGLKSLEELKEKVREGLEAQLRDELENGYKDRLVKHLVETHTFDVPPSLLREELGLAMQHVEHDHHHDHETSAGAHDHHHAHDDSDRDAKLRSLGPEMEAAATKQVKARLILDAIAAEQNLMLSENETEMEYKRLAEQMKTSATEVKRKVHGGGDRAIQRFKARLLHQKALDYIYSHANMED